MQREPDGDLPHPDRHGGEPHRASAWVSLRAAEGHSLAAARGDAALTSPLPAAFARSMRRRAPCVPQAPHGSVLLSVFVNRDVSDGKVRLQRTLSIQLSRLERDRRALCPPRPQTVASRFHPAASREVPGSSARVWVMISANPVAQPRARTSPTEWRRRSSGGPRACLGARRAGIPARYRLKRTSRQAASRGSSRSIHCGRRGATSVRIYSRSLQSR